MLQKCNISICMHYRFQSPYVKRFQNFSIFYILLRGTPTPRMYIYLQNIHLAMIFSTDVVRIEVFVFSLWETKSQRDTFKCNILFLLSKNEVLEEFLLKQLLPWQQEHHKDFEQDWWHHLLLRLACGSYFQLIMTLLRFNSHYSNSPCWVYS